MDYIDFEDIREQELSDYDVIINAGFAGSAWSGGEQWNDSRVLEKLDQPETGLFLRSKLRSFKIVLILRRKKSTEIAGVTGRG